MIRIKRCWMAAVLMISACGSSDHDTPMPDGGSATDGGGGETGTGDGGTALQASPLMLATGPAPRGNDARTLIVPTTITNSGPAAVSISLDSFYVTLDGGVLVPALTTGSIIVCSPHFKLLPGGSIRCDLEFLANASAASELRYDDGSTLPAVTTVTERPLVAGCVAEESLGVCFQNTTANAFGALGDSCASQFRVCRTTCLEGFNVSDCTCDAECAKAMSCPAVDAAIQSALTACQPPG